MTTALPVWLALVPSPVIAVEASNGVSNNTNVVMEAEVWTVLASIAVKNPSGKTRHCTVVGSADVVNPGNCGDPVPVPLLYLFTLTLDDLDPAIDGRFERTVEFNNHNCPFGADARLKEVTSTGFFVTPPGVHTIYWLGRPAPLNLTAAVDDASLTVVCTDHRPRAHPLRSHTGLWWTAAN
jgi:hypothetical protein